MVLNIYSSAVFYLQIHRDENTKLSSTCPYTYNAWIISLGLIQCQTQWLLSLQKFVSGSSIGTCPQNGSFTLCVDEYLMFSSAI